MKKQKYVSKSSTFVLFVARNILKGNARGALRQNIATKRANMATGIVAAKSRVVKVHTSCVA
jgi:hypothetical protein